MTLRIYAANDYADTTLQIVSILLDIKYTLYL
jgi:hypothetical protein